MHVINVYAKRVLFGALIFMQISLSSCRVPEDDRPFARRVEQRSELIGGPRALGEVGDYLLENSMSRFMIHDAGFSRGFGVYGGALIDADWVDPTKRDGDLLGGVGHDNLGELFPTFFLEALRPTEVPNNYNHADSRSTLPAIEVERSDDKLGVVVVRGIGDDFLALTETINEFLTGDLREDPRLVFEHRYILEADKPFLRLVTTVQNVSDTRLTFDATANFGFPITLPVGDIGLFGGGNHVFLPGDVGFDARQGIERAYAEGNKLPALPGMHAPFVATVSDDISYGLLGRPSQYNYTNATGAFPDASDSGVHIPFIASAFTALYTYTVPPLMPNDGVAGGEDAFSFERLFLVGQGDVASITDQIYDLEGRATVTLSGAVKSLSSSSAVEGISVMVLDERGRHVTHIRTREEGTFSARLPIGNYFLQTVDDNRPKATAVVVNLDGDQYIEIGVDEPARFDVTVRDADTGLLIPAKLTLVGSVPAGQLIDDIFDESLGEHRRRRPVVGRTPVSDGDYIEKVAYGDMSGTQGRCRPGDYELVVSHGPEYTVHKEMIRVAPGALFSADVVLKRVANPIGYIGADFHLHSSGSLDSDAKPDDRIKHYASEGVEYVVSTDHNFVVDYRPAIDANGFADVLGAEVGIELSTIDRGHFNGFPIQMYDGRLAYDDGNVRNDVQARTFGSFQWASKTPKFIFDELRALGQPEQTVSSDCAGEFPSEQVACVGAQKPVVVQVNHARDGVLGYFDQFNLQQTTLELPQVTGPLAPNTALKPEYAPSAFSWDFDAMEVFNGKFYDFIHNHTAPAGTVYDPVSCCPIAEGDVLYDWHAFPCDENMRDCTCTAEDAALQVARGNCERGEPLFPGLVDDWFQILRAGKRVVATGNSDSHGDGAEAGSPRTYIFAETDDGSAVTTDAVRRAFASGDVFLSNGPIVQFTIDDKKPGGTVRGNRQAWVLSLTGATWTAPDTARIYYNGLLVDEQAIAIDERQERYDVILQGELETLQDGFVVVEVVGERSLFPMVLPQDQGPLNIVDTVEILSSSLESDERLDLFEPSFVTDSVPYALSNPIWVDADSDGRIAPSLVETDIDFDTASNIYGSRGSKHQVEEHRHAHAHRHDEVDFGEGAEQALGPWLESNFPRTLYPSLSAYSRRQRMYLRSLPRFLWPIDPHYYPDGELNEVGRVLRGFAQDRHMH